jgi:hypothetical protein
MGSAVRDDHIALESVKLSQAIQNTWIDFPKGNGELVCYMMMQWHLIKPLKASDGSAKISRQRWY